MGKGKCKKSSSETGSGGGSKALRLAIEEVVNEAVSIQDSASDLGAADAAATLEAATHKYREALSRLPGHAEAGYNLATCLSEQADLKRDPRQKVMLLRESRGVLEGVIAADTSGRGATTALAHHALGNVIRALVEAFRDHCPTAPCPDCLAIRCPSAAECQQELAQACRHLEAAISVSKRLQNQAGGVEEALVHWGDVLSSMMQIVMDGCGSSFVSGQGTGGRPLTGSASDVAAVREALALCSNACSKYSEALESGTTSGVSDTDTLRLKAGTIVNFLDWALPEAPHQPLGGMFFSPEALLVTGEQAVGVLLGLDENNVSGLLAMGDLCRLRARVSMLLGAGVQEETRWREASAAWFARAVSLSESPLDSETLTAAGEGLLEYGRRCMTVYKEAVSRAAGGFSLSAGFPSLLEFEPMRSSAVSRLQEAGNLLSRACSADASDADLPYNAACAFALSGDAPSCSRALGEFCRRLTQVIATDGGVSWTSSKRDAARRSLEDAGGDVDLESVRGAPWFDDLLRRTDAALAGAA